MDGYNVPNSCRKKQSGFDMCNDLSDTDLDYWIVVSGQ